MKIFLNLLVLMATSFVLAAQPDVSLEQYASGFNDPVAIVNAGDERLFIVEQPGTIKIIDGNGDVLPDPFLQISTNSSEWEQGLLGLAFHPDYADNGYFYIHYTLTGNNNGRIARFSVDPTDPNKADPNSEVEVMTIQQPANNHNGGHLLFGPDGYMYIGLGDGGGGDDPWGNSQNPETLLGKMLRIDVDNGSPYAIPADNPFIDDTDVLDEIWAIGLRNPWRYSFDRLTGDLWISDVGQRDEEEIDFVPSDNTTALNFGWDCFQGDLDSWMFQSASPLCDSPVGTITFPVIGYDFSGNNSVTGGCVYRGCEYPDLVGHYLYADYMHGRIWTLVPDGGGGWTNTQVATSSAISTFGEDVEGNLYLARHNNGVIYKITTSFTPDDIAISYDEPNDELTAPDGYEAYQWYQNGMPLSGATSQTIGELIPMGTANYYCELTYNMGTCTMNTNEVMVIGVGVDQIRGVSHFSVQPNPFSDEVIIDLVTDSNMDITIDFLNVKGEVVYALPQSETMPLRQKVNLNHLSNGVYFVRVQSAEGKMTRKLVKR